jgi:hypothetical protein
MSVLLIDPYANPMLSRADIRVMNQVADNLVDEFGADPDAASRAIRAAHKPGMAAAALRTHALRALGKGGP